MLAVNKTRGKGFTGFEDGLPQFEDFRCYNFLLILYLLDLDFNLLEFQLLENLSPFENWIRNLEDFKYENFDLRWLLITDRVCMLKRFEEIKPIEIALKRHLKKDYEPALARIYHEYFSSME